MFSDKRKEFIKTMRAKMPVESTIEPSNTGCSSDVQTDEDLMALLEKQFDELFGPLDDND